MGYWRAGPAGSRPVSSAQARTSDHDHAGRPPTCQRGSGNTDRCRHWSTVARATRSRRAISTAPTTSSCSAKPTPQVYRKA